MKYKISFLGILVCTGLTLNGNAAETCATALVKNQSKDCKSLEVSFDLRGCEASRRPEGQTQSQATNVKCLRDGKRARATLSLNGFSYEATLSKKGSSGWGGNSGGSWETAHVSEKSEGRSVAASAPVNLPVEQPAAPSAEAAKWEFGVFMDTYYQMASTRPQGTLPVSYRNYDLLHNQFTLNLAEISISKKGKEFSFLADLDYGKASELNATDESKHIGQFNFTYTPLSASMLSFTVGKFYSHVGYEVAKSKDNANYSRSLGFTYLAPVWHSGAAVAWTVVPEKFITSFYLYNGWNALEDSDHAKHYGLQAKWMPISSVTAIYNFLEGREGTQNPTTTFRSKRVLHDFNLNWNAPNGLVFALDFGLRLDRELQGLSYTSNVGHAEAVYAKIPLSEKVTFSPRVERFSDSHGFLTSLTTDQRIFSYTGTLSFKAASELELRFEGRHDRSNHSVFTSKDGTTGSGQTTGTLSILFTN